MKIIKNDAYSAILDADTIREAARRLGEEEGLARYIAAIERFYASAEPELIRLATAIARKIVGEELRTSPEAIVAIVREALAAARGERIVIRVHPSAAALVRKSVGQEVQVTASESVAPGGCVIESEFGIVDGQLETQLRVIERALL
jgi:flagellar biosynthesis/type III secretory pathway protein FliH